MYIEITPQAVEYLHKEKMDAVTVEMMSYGCWAGSFDIPVVKAGLPENKHSFFEYESGNVRVFLDPNFEGDGVVISYHSRAGVLTVKSNWTVGCKIHV